MPDFNIITELKKSQIFEYATDDALKTISKIISKLEIKATDVLINKGEVGDSMYIVQRGALKSMMAIYI